MSDVSVSQELSKSKCMSPGECACMFDVFVCMRVHFVVCVRDLGCAGMHVLYLVEPGFCNLTCLVDVL